VLTTPAGVIFRMRLLPQSATYTLPAASTAKPLGLLNWAAAPVPSLYPLSLPARVVTIKSFGVGGVGAAGALFLQALKQVVMPVISITNFFVYVINYAFNRYLSIIGCLFSGNMVTPNFSFRWAIRLAIPGSDG